MAEEGFAAGGKAIADAEAFGEAEVLEAADAGLETGKVRLAEMGGEVRGAGGGFGGDEAEDGFGLGAVGAGGVEAGQAFLQIGDVVRGEVGLLPEGDARVGADEAEVDAVECAFAGVEDAEELGE